MFVFLLLPLVTQADDVAADAMELERLGNDIADDIQRTHSLILKLQEKNERLNELNEDLQSGSLKAKQAAEEAIQENSLYQEKIESANQAYRDMEENFELYVHQQRARQFTPIVLGVLVALYSNADAESERLAHGLAGYGAGAALEATGYGLGNPIGYLTYKVWEW